jgi:hypothetical protein
MNILIGGIDPRLAERGAVRLQLFENVRDHNLPRKSETEADSLI